MLSLRRSTKFTLERTNPPSLKGTISWRFAVFLRGCDAGPDSRQPLWLKPFLSLRVTSFNDC